MSWGAIDSMLMHVVLKKSLLIHFCFPYIVLFTWIFYIFLNLCKNTNSDKDFIISNLCWRLSLNAYCQHTLEKQPSYYCI